jgi:hypothetical protein
MSTSIWCQSGR